MRMPTNFKDSLTSSGLVNDQFPDFNTLPAVTVLELDTLYSLLDALHKALVRGESGPTGCNSGTDLHGIHGTQGDPLAANASAKVIPFLESSLAQAEPMNETRAKELSKVGTFQNFQHEIITGTVCSVIQICTCLPRERTTPFIETDWLSPPLQVSSTF
jgi:hypothetical protein